ncbi:MAG: hypothetical protein U5N86_02105 [Planctomycetota bacterium]|nr:hypothetical protein [Planctomycetota bacterium]
MFALAEEGARPVAVVFSSQSQGALFACRCPFNPEGGLARRAAVVSELRKSYDVTLVDAGGWMPGGVYDEMASGEEEAKRRAKIIVKAYEAMGYDVLGVGEDDLALGTDALEVAGKLSLVRGNIRGDIGGSAYVIRDGTAFISVAGENFPTALYTKARKLSADAPGEFLAKQVAEARNSGAERVVALFQMTERETIELVRKVDGIDLAFVSHRTAVSRPPYNVGKTLVAGLEPLGTAVLSWVPGKGIERTRLGMAMPTDEKISRMLAQAGYVSNSLEKVPLDIYVMARCPYGRPALEKLLDIREKLGEHIELTIRYVLDFEDGKLSSMHGEDELEETRRMLAVWLADKDKLDDYLEAADEEKFEFARWLVKVGIDPWRIKASLDSGEVDAELKLHARQCEARGINASPTLLIANEEYGGPFDDVERILFAICSRLSEPGDISSCSQLPECYSDSDCFEFGKVIVCEKPGTKDARCVEVDEPRVDAVCIRPDGALADPFESVVSGMRRWMPTLKVREVSETSEEGRNLLQKHDISRLPAFVFSGNIEKAHYFKELESSFVKSRGSYIAAAGTYFANTRADIPVRRGMELFISPYSKFAGEVVRSLGELGEAGSEVRLRFMVAHQDGEIVGARGISEGEEAARMWAALQLDREKGMAYILERFKRPGSSYWARPAEVVGIDPNELRELALSAKALDALKEDAKLAETFSPGGEAFLLHDGREVVTFNDITDFEVLLWINSQ